MRFLNAGARSGHPIRDRDLVFSIPNVITVVRFLGVPLFVWLVLIRGNYGAGVLVLALMAGTDWIDGYVARRFNQMTHLGRILDPIADRLALITVAITLVIAGIAPWWLLAALLVPDAILMVVTLRLFRWHPDLPVSVVGKVRTAALLLGTPLLLLGAAVGPQPQPPTIIAWIFLGIGVIGHWIAAWNYYHAMHRKHRNLIAAGTEGPTGGPTSGPTSGPSGGPASGSVDGSGGASNTAGGP
jgi:cardiolipin synthase (CMP-forming)